MREGYEKRSTDWLYGFIAVLCTFIVWAGVIHSGFTPDDYMVIDIQSPIRSFVDVISMFWRYDPNPQYWRPLSDASVSLDFLLWGWNGGMFHLTNFLLHCIATCLVYFFARRIFSFTAIAACTLAIIFGVSAAH